VKQIRGGEFVPTHTCILYGDVDGF